MSSSPPPPPWSRWTLILVLLGFLAVMFLMPAIGAVIPLPRRADRRTIQLVLSMSGTLVAMVGVLAVVVLDGRRKARFVDWALTAAGLQPSSYLVRGRQGQGTVGGRPVQAYWVPPSKYRPGSLEITASSQVRTRLAAGDRSGSAAAEALGRSELRLGDLDLAHLRITADEEPWARALLGHPDARATLVRLSRPAAGEVRWVRIEPGAVHLRTAGIPVAQIVPDLVQPAVEDLARLATLAEGAPPPAHPAEATTIERALRDRGGFTGCLIVAVVLVLVLLATVGTLVAMQGSR